MKRFTLGLIVALSLFCQTAQAATYGQFVELGPYFTGGLIVSAAKVYHYSAGTETNKDCYSDRAKTTPVADPLVLDGQGVGGMFCDGIYKFVVKTSGGSTLYTFDNVAVSDQTQTLVGEGAALASTATLILGTDGDFFHVTGTTGITALSGSQTQVVLVFDSALTLFHSGTLTLNSAVNLTTSAGVAVGFVNEGGGGWREIFRSVPQATIGTNGSIPMARSEATGGLLYVFPFLKHISGLNWLPDFSDTVNDIQINPGVAMDASGAYLMRYAASIIKQSDAVWAVGSNAGALDDIGSAGNNDFYIWMIARSDTGVVDFLFSLSSTAPTMPTNYDFKRLMGWFKRSGGAIVAFSTYETAGGGIEFLWASPTLDVNLANTLTTARRTDAVKVPLNFSTTANINVALADVANPTAWIYCPDQTDLAPSITVAPLNSIMSEASAAVYVNMQVRTSSAGLIAARAITATVDLYAVSTMGFTWDRRN